MYVNVDDACKMFTFKMIKNTHIQKNPMNTKDISFCFQSEVSCFSWFNVVYWCGHSFRCPFPYRYICDEVFSIILQFRRLLFTPFLSIFFSSFLFILSFCCTVHFHYTFQQHFQFYIHRIHSFSFIIKRFFVTFKINVLQKWAVETMIKYTHICIQAIDLFLKCNYVFVSDSFSCEGFLLRKTSGF